jgi:RHS repeat-associated protein
MAAIYPDGSIHTLYLEDTQNLGSFGLEDPTDGGGWYGFNPGVANSPYPITRSSGFDTVALNLPPNTVPFIPGVNPVLTYYTKDGTRLRVIIPIATLENDSWEDMEWTMNYPDGRKIKGYSLKTESIKDRNNNEITIENTGNSCGYEGYPFLKCISSTIKDSYNRSIQVNHLPYVDNQSATEIIQDGYNTNPNNPLKWTITHEFAYKVFNYACDNFINQCSFPNNPATYVGIPVVTKIDIPGFTSSLSYRFEYNETSSGEYSEYGLQWFTPFISPQGRMTDILLPYHSDTAEAKIQFLYYGYPQTGDMTDNPVIVKDINYKDYSTNPPTSRSDEWFYVWGVPALDGSTYNKVKKPDGGEEHHYSFNSYDGSKPFRGHTYKIVYPDGSQLENEWAGKSITQTNDNPYIKTQVHTLPPSGPSIPSMSTVTCYDYDLNGNMTAKNEYDWMDYTGVNRSNGYVLWTGSGQPKRSTALEYYVNANAYPYWSPDTNNPTLLNALRSKGVTGVTGTASYAVYDYDDYTTTGNLKWEWHWDNDNANQNHSIEKVYTYNNNGNLLTMTDSRNIHTSYVYGDSYHPYPTEIHEADGRYEFNGDVITNGTENQRDWQFKWDAATGLLLWEKDVNNNITTWAQYDVRGRQIALHEGAPSYNSPGIRQTHTIYNDSPVTRTVTVAKDLETAGDQKVKFRTTMDNLGRVWRTESTDDNDSSESMGIQTKNFERVVSGAGTYKLTSNPFRGTDGNIGWTRTKLDQMNRTVEVAYFDLSQNILPYPWGTPDCENNCTGKATSVYSTIINGQSPPKRLSTVTITDEAGKTRMLGRDGLNRLVQVTEAGSTDTYYEHDGLDNLIWVDQRGQTRSFTFSSLGRLLSATNPENGTQSYAYDANGNVTSRSENQTVGVTMTYDYLNRIKTKTYTDGTPEVIYQYGSGILLNEDCPASYAAGRLVSISNSLSNNPVSSYTYNCYDALGRVLVSTQRTANISYNFRYSYQAGYLQSETYPGGRVAGYSATNRGLPKSVSSSGITGNATSYTASGAPGQIEYGNGVIEKRGYNNQLQMAWLEVIKSGTTILSLSNGYAPVPAKNYGNLYSQTIVYPGNSQTQNYDYDAFNRISSFSEAGKSRTYRYDDWGNPWVENNTTGLPPTNMPTVSNTYASNRRTNDPNSQKNQEYDERGNQTTYGPITLADNTTRAKLTLEYNVDNLQKSMTDGINTSERYTYDGEGRRVMKETWNNSKSWEGFPGRKIIYVYDVFGRLMAEYSTSRGTVERRYQTTDQLGSIRLVTDSAGDVVHRFDYFPFGEEIPYGINGRSAGYPTISGSDDGQSMKFTGKERDAETGLDYFGFRYYSGAQGRWTSPDQPFADQHPEDPQSWNLYGYVRNSPLRYVDPNGRQEEGTLDFKSPLDFQGALDYVKSLFMKKVNDTISIDQPPPEPPKHILPGIPTKDEAAKYMIVGMNQGLDIALPYIDFACVYPVTKAWIQENPIGVALGFIGMALAPSSLVDFPTKHTVNWSAEFASEGEARAFARAKLGSNPIEVEAWKWRSANGKWQYRAKPGDLMDNHIHLEELLENGEIKQNLHLRWPTGTNR